MYVNGYLFAVPETEKDAYTAVSEVFIAVARDFGALEIYENWELEVPDGERTDFRKAVLAQPGEKVVFSWVVWPDRETGAAAHRGMWDDPRMLAAGPPPVDGKRMVLGGFEPLVSFRRSDSEDVLRSGPET